MTREERTTLTVRVSRADLESFEAQAAQAGMSRSEWVRGQLVKNGGGDDTRSRATEKVAASTAVRNDVDPVRDARAAGATDLGERSHPTPPPFKPNRDLIGYIEAGQHPPGQHPPDEGRTDDGCHHPRWRRLAGICLRCGEKIK